MRAAETLTAAVALLMFAASLWGLLGEGLYLDNPLVRSGWLGNDVVTLLVATPALVAALLSARRGSTRGRLVWLGLLAYTFYNYAFYLFGTAYNALFLVYVAIMTASGFALAFGLSNLDAVSIAGHFRPETPVKRIAAYVAVISALLGGFWIVVTLQSLVRGRPPAMMEATGGTTNLVAALDLSLVVTVGALAGFWLWHRRPWGYVLATIWNVKGAVYMLALSAASITAWRAGAAANITQLGLWAPIGIGCTMASLVLLRSCR
jgi:hypothetical protein